MAARGGEGGISPLTVEEFLHRIGLHPTTSSSIAEQFPPILPTLVALQNAAVTHLPFENLDVAVLKREIVLDSDRILHKVVRERRGGFCFELNTSFYWLLTALGFEVYRVSARIWRNGAFGLPNTHMALIVTLGGERYLVDLQIGNGNCPYAPLHLAPAEVQTHGQHGHAYVLRPKLGADPATAGTWRFFERLPAKVAASIPAPDSDEATPNVARYSTLTATEASLLPPEDGWAENLIAEMYDRPVPLDTFEHMCKYHQSDARSPFMQGIVVTIARVGGGRDTVSSGLWSGAAAGDPAQTFNRRDGAHTPRSSEYVLGNDHLKEIFAHHFGIDL